MDLTKNYYIFTILLLLFMVSLGFAEENAVNSTKNESAVTFGAEIDFNSRYVWHGIPWSEGAVMQPSVWVSVSDFSFTVWNNFILNHEPNHGQFNEIDYTFAYSKEWNLNEKSRFLIEPALNYYQYPNQEESPSTAELAVKLGYAIDPIEIFSNHNVDIKEYGGAYFGDIGIKYTRELNSQLSFEGSASLGWGSSKFNETYLDLAKTALNVAQCEISLTYTSKSALGGVYFRPHIAVSTILDNELQKQVDDSTIVYGGIAIGKEF